MPRRRLLAVENALPHRLRRLAIPWGELERRTLLPARQLRALRAPAANPPLTVAERVADALDLRVEDLWRLRSRRGC